jgi:hypothetical protein
MDYHMAAALMSLVGRFPSGGQGGELDTIIGPGADGKNVLDPLGFGRVSRAGQSMERRSDFG